MSPALLFKDNSHTYYDVVCISNASFSSNNRAYTLQQYHHHHCPEDGLSTCISMRAWQESLTWTGWGWWGRWLQWLPSPSRLPGWSERTSTQRNVPLFLSGGCLVERMTLWKSKTPFWRPDKRFLRGGLAVAPVHVHETLREICGKQADLKNLLWSFSTQETILKRWIGPISARTNRLKPTIPIRVSLP